MTMRAGAIALALLLQGTFGIFGPLGLQDAKPSDVEKQAARIGDKDAQASFDAISRLVELSAGSKAEVEAAAARLPEFYRAALLEELKARESLGDRYGKETRVSIDAKEKSLSTVIDELKEKTKEKIDAYWIMQSRGSQAVTLKVDDVPIAEAIRTLCAEAKIRANFQCGFFQLFDGGGGGGGPSFQFRNFLFTAQSVQRTREVEFGGKATRVMSLSMTTLWDRAVTVVKIKSAELIECQDDKGRPVRGLPLEEKPPTGDTAIFSNVNYYATAPALRLEWPADDAEKLARVRGAFVVLVPDQSTVLRMKEAEKGTKIGDEHFEATLEGIRSDRNRTEAVIRLKPLKMSLDEFRKLSVSFRIKAKEMEERICYGTGRASDGVVEYTINPRLMGEEQVQRKALELESVEVVIHRTTAERKLHFEFRDIPLK